MICIISNFDMGAQDFLKARKFETIVKLLWPSQKENFNFTLFQLASVVLKSHKLHVYILPLFVNCVVCFSNLCDFMSSLVGNSTTHISHKNLGNWSWCSLSKWTSNAAHSDQKFSYFRVLPKFKSLKTFFENKAQSKSFMTFLAFLGT